MPSVFCVFFYIYTSKSIKNVLSLMDTYKNNLF